MLCGIAVFIKLDSIRKQYCGITIQPVYCSTLIFVMVNCILAYVHDNDKNKVSST